MAFPGSPFRPTAISRVLVDQLNFRLAVLATPLVATPSLDSLGNQVITVIQPGVAWGTTHQFCLIQILSTPAWTNVNTDALGLTQTVWTPDQINVATECVGAVASVAAAAIAKTQLNIQTELAILGAVLGFGTRVVWYATGVTVQPSISSGIMQGYVGAVFDDLFNPTTATM